MMEHCTLLCNNDCALLRANYVEDLRDTARMACQEAFRRLGISDEVVIVNATNVDDYDGRSVALTSPVLRRGHLSLLTSGIPSYQELCDFYRSLAYVLFPSTPGWADCRLELLLWSAVNCREVAALRVTLANHPYVIPICLLGSLLRVAVDGHFDDGVRLLLEYGTPPDLSFGNGSRDLPLVRICYDGSPIRDVSLCPHNYSKPVENIVRSLVTSGANLSMNISKRSHEIPLHYIGHLALRSSCAARFLIESTPSASLSTIAQYIGRYERIFGADVGATPLETAFIDAALVTTSEDGARQKKVARILAAAVFPLLRAGATLSCDPFDFAELNQFRLLVRFCSLTRLANAAIDWPHHIVNLIVDLRRKSGIKMSALMQNLALLFQLGWPNYAYRFHELVSHCYPRSLMHISRDAVLVQLPIGAHSRPKAIRRLNLPSDLTDFLEFREHEILLEILSQS